MANRDDCDVVSRAAQRDAQLLKLTVGRIVSRP